MTGPGIDSYSTTPSENVQANTGITWDEGMATAQVNNSARQNMTDARLAMNDLPWFAYGTGSKNTVIPVYASSTSVTVAGIDVTAYWHAGRRVRAVGSGTGTIYGKIASSSFSTNTTINFTWDSGSLSNEALAIYGSIIPVTGSPIPFVDVVGINATQTLTNKTFVAPVLGGATATTLDASGQITAGDGATFHTRGFGFTADFTSTGLSSSNSFTMIAGGSGGVILNTGATSWASVSDETLKTGLVPIVGAVQKVASLRAVTGRYKTDAEGVSRSFLIAQDVQNVLPEAVTAADDGKLSLRYTEVIPLIVAAIRELTGRISTLEGGAQ